MNNKEEFFVDFFFFMFDIQHCFICRPSDSTVSEDAGIEPRIVATMAWTVMRSIHSARSHPLIRRTMVHLEIFNQDLLHNKNTV
jgi:hypothetical protein